jgi:hypothetical protein
MIRHSWITVYNFKFAWIELNTLLFFISHRRYKHIEVKKSKKNLNKYNKKKTSLWAYTISSSS